MTLEAKLVRLRRIFLIGGTALGLFGGVMLAFTAPESPANPPSAADPGVAAFRIVGPSPTHITPAATATVQTGPSPTPAVVEPKDPPLPTPTVDNSASLAIRRPVVPTPLAATATPVPPPSPTPAAMSISIDMLAEESYTSTQQVHAREEAAPACPATSSATFDLIPIEGQPIDHPANASGDLRLTLRGYQAVSATLASVSFYGDTDSDAPQLSGLFQPNRGPAIAAAYQVNRWLWQPAQCGGSARGCPGEPLLEWDVTLIGLAANPGEPVSIPERAAEIYPGGYRALVLYADETQVTLGYTRRDTVAVGYAVHLLGLCVDANLVALYRAQNNPEGWRVGGALPALRVDQVIGTARGGEIKAAVRDNGTFMDPRSGKDWWRGY